MIPAEARGAPEGCGDSEEVEGPCGWRWRCFGGTGIRLEEGEVPGGGERGEGVDEERERVGGWRREEAQSGGAGGGDEEEVLEAVGWGVGEGGGGEAGHEDGVEGEAFGGVEAHELRERGGEVMGWE